MFGLEFHALLVTFTFLLRCNGQEYDFAAEITRQCLVPDPVGLLDCVEKKVTLPYLTSWVDCTNSLGQNVRTSADIINYRCKSVWEGKGVIPEVFYIKDCVIEKTGLPAKNVSAEVLGAYKECKSGSLKPQQGRIKTVQQSLGASTVEYNTPKMALATPPQQQFQIPSPPPVQSPIPVSIQGPIQQVFQAPAPRPVQQMPVTSGQQFQTPAARPPPIMAQQIFQAPQPQVPAITVAQQQLPVAFNQQYQSQMIPRYQPQMQARPIQQAPVASNQQYRIPASGPQNQATALQARSFPTQPYSQQYFAIYPQAPFPNQQQRSNQPILSTKNAASPPYLTQQQIDVGRSNSYASAVSNTPFMYSFQINHPQRSVY